MSEHIITLQLTPKEARDLEEVLYETTGHHPENWTDWQKDIGRLANKLARAQGKEPFGEAYLQPVPKSIELTVPYKLAQSAWTDIAHYCGQVTMTINYQAATQTYAGTIQFQPPADWYTNWEATEDVTLVVHKG